MKTGNPFRNMSTAELLNAADSKEDSTYWHLSLGSLLVEIANRLRTDESLIAVYGRAKLYERVTPSADS